VYDSLGYCNRQITVIKVKIG